MKINLGPLFIAFFLMIFFGCNKDETQAVNSLEGTWDIVTITSHYGGFSENVYNADTVITETGQLGSFTFTENVADYSFQRDNKFYAGNENWVLQHERVNSGFFKVSKFTLTIENQFVFDVLFEDGTNNAELKARNISFLEIPMEKTDVLIGMELDKR